jgi:hypothetical protein
MISVRLMPRDEYAPELRHRFGCDLIDEGRNKNDPYYGWAYWRTKWGFYFYVPEIGPEKLCPEPRFTEILNEVEATRSP